LTSFKQTEDPTHTRVHAARIRATESAKRNSQLARDS